MGKHENQPGHKLGCQIGRHMKKGNIKTAFPHAILHEASITFLGFGLSPEKPAIGIILSESMKYLAMGKWWLALFPGLFLVLVVLMFHCAGQAVCRMIDPGSAHE